MRATINVNRAVQGAFLDSLRSQGKLDYKRYLGSPLRYAGGKSLGVGYVVERLPRGIKRLISPFIGGGAVEIACAKEMGIEVLAYDIFDILVNYWQRQLNAPGHLADLLSQFSPTRDTFWEVKARLKEHWDGERLLAPDSLAAHYYFNSQTSYGPHFLGWPSDVYLNEPRYEALLSRVRNFTAQGLSVECASFEKVIPLYPDDVLYCDPPYYLEEGKTFVGMYPHRNFPVHHKGFDHAGLRDLLLSRPGGFILSYNDCSTIREWYEGCDMFSPVWQYTFGQGDTRIGINRRRDNNGSHVKKSHELLIWRTG